MGQALPALAGVLPIATAVVDLLSIRGQPAGDNPTHQDIEAAERLQQGQGERERAVQEAREETERLAAVEAARAEAERIRGEADEARAAVERAAQAHRDNCIVSTMGVLKRSGFPIARGQGFLWR
ncbi:hypothetical protein C8R45DRAFT_1220106 [Mycena sanguinolenta]|nr:hypothetical protein C8R45DRAFT_1220106 [Mycena sanguinolenta]